MDFLLMIMSKIWNVFINTGFDVVFQGNTYHITLIAIFLFTSITAIAIKVLFSFFD